MCAVEAAEAAKGKIEATMTTWQATVPGVPRVPLALDIRSDSDKFSFYKVDLADTTCDCPDWKRSRSQHMPGDLSRCCKHVREAYEMIEPESGWPFWLGKFIEEGSKGILGWITAFAWGSPILIGISNRGLYEVFAKRGMDYDKFCYDAQRGAWDGGGAPDHESQIALFLHAMFEGEISAPCASPSISGLGDIVEIRDFAEKRLAQFHSEFFSELSAPGDLPQGRVSVSVVSVEPGEEDAVELEDGKECFFRDFHVLATDFQGRTWLFASAIGNTLDSEHSTRAEVESSMRMAHRRTQDFARGVADRGSIDPEEWRVTTKPVPRSGIPTDWIRAVLEGE